MGLFGGKKKAVVAPEPAEVKEEKAKAKARLLETEGENKGVQLQANQGQTIRKVFGN